MTTSKPPKANICAETIPADLRNAIRWVTWKWQKRNDKWTKPPYIPGNGHYAKSNDPDTWGGFETAYQDYTTGRADGIGFTFTDSDLCGIDLDHCLNADGTLQSWAAPLVDSLASYTEISPSGDGLHIIVKGKLPPGRRRGHKGTIYATVEVYDTSSPRYFTVTGHHWPGTPTTIKERQEALASLHAELERQAQPAKATAMPSSTGTAFDDTELVEKARNAKNGARFKALFDKGDTGEYEGDASRADLALCEMLAFWGNQDTQKIDALFRKSALMRDKWDERHSADGQTYGEMTISAAISYCTEGYNPDYGQSPTGERPPQQEAIENAGNDLDALLEALSDAEGVERDRLVEQVFSFLAALPVVTQTRYKDAVREAADLSARDYNRLLNNAQKALQRDAAAALGDNRYTIEAGCHCTIRFANGQTYTEPLCNFTAAITEDARRDNGEEIPTREFTVKGKLADGTPLYTGKVEAGKFSGMTWLQELWGIQAIIRAGRDTKDKLREAIQLNSQDAVPTHIHTHTGWGNDEGQRVYFHAGGAVGAENVNVDLGHELRYYQLPQPPTGAEACAAMKASLRFLDITKHHITVPLWAAMFLAPLSEIIRPDFVLWLYARTGSLKSTLAATVMSHYGKFTNNDFAIWDSTANRLEMTCFVLKDAPFVIDDFTPLQNPHKSSEMETTVAQIVENVGNGAGRGRLKRDRTAAQTFRPRGLVIGIGEQIPNGHAVQSRMYTLELHPGDVTIANIDKVQPDQDYYATAMAGFLAWIGPQWEELKKKLPAAHKETRAQAVKKLPGVHLRLPDSMALLYVGFDMGIAYAVEVGALTEAEADAWRDKAVKALEKGIREQAQLVEQQNPTIRFLEILETLLEQGKVRLEPKDGSGPWLGGDAQSERLGWYDEEYYYLMQTAAYNRIAEFLRSEGAYLGIKDTTLRKYLVEEKVLEEDSNGRNTKVIKINGENKRLAWYVRAKIAEILEKDEK